MAKRWAGQLISREESLALLNDIARWCRRTGTNYNKLVGDAGVAPSFRSFLRSRRTECVSLEISKRLRDAMKCNPHGIKVAKYHGRSSSAKAGYQPAEIVQLVRVNRDPCFSCGWRGDLGHSPSCQHFESYVSAG